MNIFIIKVELTEEELIKAIEECFHDKGIWGEDAEIMKIGEAK